MKLLWVKAGGLVPLNLGGKIRSFHLAKALAEKHSVTMFTFYAEHPDDQHHTLETVFDEVVCLPLPIASGRGTSEAFSYLGNVFSRRPFAFSKYCRPEVATAVRRLVEEGDFDAIVCDFLVPAPVIPWDRGVPTVIFTHNVEAAIWRRHYDVARNPLWKAACWREFRTTDRAERHYLNRADHVIAVSEADRDTFAEFIDPAKVTIVPTGVDLDYFRPVDEAAASNRLVFTGAMDWMANEDAMAWFVAEILPLVRARVDGAELVIVGRNPTVAVRSLGEQPGVTVTGEVDDIRPYVHDGAVYVVPLRVGGGTRLKIFEAMAMGKAIVSTSIGAEGLPVETEVDIVLADGAEAFARATIDLLRDDRRRADIGRRAHELVARQYSWAAAAEHFERALRAATAR